MEPLFPIAVGAEDIPAIAGLTYLVEYLKPAEEAELAAAIDAEPWDTSWERRRQPYGASYGRKAAASRPLPDWGQGLIDRMYREGLSECPFDQMLVNEYLPGQGIAMHTDYEPFDRTVVSISLLAPCVMDFRRLEDRRRETLLLQPRSLLILSDEARYQWEHGIARRKTDRWHGLPIKRQRRLSVTFRLLKRNA